MTTRCARSVTHSSPTPPSLSEHAKLTGADPARFVVARLGSAALFASDAQLIALRDQQAGIERRLAEVRALKAQLHAGPVFRSPRAGAGGPGAPG